MIGIVATDCEGGIGKNGGIPWKLPEDLKRFRRLTTDCKDPDKRNVVIMGRKTWMSINKQLPNRINIVLSKTLKNKCGITFLANCKDEVVEYLRLNKYKINKVFVIGGKGIYDLFYNYINTFELTVLKGVYKCDTKIELRTIYSDFEIIKVNPEEEYVNLTLKKRRLR